MYVVSAVTADGERRRADLAARGDADPELGMTTTDPDLLPGSVRVAGPRWSTPSTAPLLAHRDSVGTNPQRIRLRAPRHRPLLQLHRRRRHGRRLADRRRAAPWPASWAWTSTTTVPAAVVRRVVTAPGTVLNVACLRPSEDFDEPRAPAAGPPATGLAGDLRGIDRGDRLLAQLEG